MKGKTNEKNALFWRAVRPVRNCVGGNPGAGHAQFVECPDPQDPGPSRDHLLAGPRSARSDASALRRLGYQNAQYALRPRLEQSDARATPALSRGYGPAAPGRPHSKLTRPPGRIVPQADALARLAPEGPEPRTQSRPAPDKSTTIPANTIPYAAGTIPRRSSQESPRRPGSSARPI